MKSYNLYLSILMVMFFLLSCKKRTDQNISLKFAETMVSEELPIDFMLGKPYQLKISDSLLLIADHVDEKAITIYNYKNNKYLKEVINIGQGPSEIILPIQLTIREKDTIGILERQKGLYSTFLISDILTNTVQCLNQINFGNIDRITETNNGYISAGFYEEGSIGIHNIRGELINVIDIYPDYLNKINDISIKYRYGQGSIAFNKESNIFAFAGYFIGEIKFYSLNDSNKLEIRNYYNLSLSSDLQRRINASTNTTIERTDIEYFTDIYTTDHYFYVLYSGKSMDEREKARESHILLFNSAGKYVKCYESDRKLYKICVSPDDKHLYALSLSAELDYILVQLNLS